MSASAPIADAAAPAAATPGLLGTAARRALVALGLILLGLLFLYGGDTWLGIVNATMIYAIAALGLNVLSGYAGQVSLGIAFFMAIGFYVAAWLGGAPPTSSFDHAGLGLSFLIWLPAAGVAAALVGALIGPAALRLKGFYLGIVSLALVVLGQHIFTNIKQIAPITGGPAGRSAAAPAFGDFSFASPSAIAGVTLSKEQLFFILILLVLLLAGLFVGNVARSRAGRAFQAVRDNEVGAVIMGVNLFEAKMGAFVLSSFLAGISGALYAGYRAYAIPDQWSLTFSIQFVAAIIIGGVASVWGSILGAAFVFAVPLVIQEFSVVPQTASSSGPSVGDLNTIIYGLLILAFLLFEPAGVVGLIRRVQGWAQRLDSRRGKGGVPTS